MKNLYITYRERRSGGEAKNPEEMYSDRYPTHIEYSLEGAFTAPPESVHYEALGVSDKLKDTVYVVLVRYEDGDTFGHSTGNGKIVAGFTTEKAAQKVANAIKNDTYDGYRCWKGYFCRFESVCVVRLTVADNSQKEEDDA